MGWGKEWLTTEQAKVELDAILHGQGFMQNGLHVPLDKIYPNFKNLTEAYANVRTRNLKPTHDPYTNPNAHIYYECSCGLILDPQTKSFAQLNNYASDKGWKIRFTDNGYVPYCVKCGERVE